MRKLKRLFFLFLLLLPWLLTYSQAVKKTSAPPVIDGLADKVFQTIYPQSVTTVIDGKIDKDFNATVQLLWDAQNLYLFAHVVDPSKVNTGIGPDGKFGQDKNDHIDIMVDMDQVYPYNKTDGNGSWWNAFDNNDFQISFLRDSSFISIGGQKADSTTRSNLALAITFQTKEVPNGWNLEAKIPWNKLDASITKEALSTIGFDITVGDRDKPATDSSAIDSRVRMGSNQRGLSNLGAWFMGTFYGDPYSWLTLTLDDDSRVATEAIAPAIELFSNSPVIDGTADDIWSTISSRKVTSVIDGKLDNQFEATTKVAWDANNLYVFAHVVDPSKVNTGIGPDGKFGQDKNDHIDIMVDMDQVYPYNKTDGNGSWWNAFDNNDFQISFLRDSSFISIGGQKADSTTRSNLALAITFQTKEVPNGWNLEAKIPWNKLDASITKEALSTIGFDITVGDRDKPASDSSAIDSRVRMGSNQRGLSNLGAWFIGTFYGDPFSWLNLTLVDSSGQIANTPKGQKVNWETEIVSTSGVVYNKGNEAITLVPTDAYIQAADFNEKIVLSKGATFELKDSGGLVLADTDSIGDKAILVITSEDKQNSRTVTINLSPSYYITATTIGVLKPTSIVDIPEGTTVSELTAGLTLAEGSQGAMVVLASDLVTVATGNVTISQVIKVVSLRGLNNYYTLDSYFGLNTSGIGELSLPNRFIGKISDGTTVEQLIAGLTYTADVTTVKVYTADTVELLAADVIVTGNILKLSSDTKKVYYSLETIIPTVLGLVEKFDSPVDINLWSPNSAMVADNSRKVFIVSQEETALKIDMQQVAFPDGQWYSLNNFDMTDTNNRYVSFRCKVDAGMTWNSVPAATIPMQLSPWNSKKHPANRYNAVAYTIKSDGKWAYYYYDFNKAYAEAPADADWSFINGLLLETVVWPNTHAGIFWLDEFRVGNEVARNPNLAGIKVDGVDIANFDRDTLTYTVTLASTATSFPSIVATTEDPRASFTAVNSSDVKAAGANTVVTGISADGTVTKLYTIKYFIPDETKDATLESLSLSEGTLTPEFNRMIMDYTVVYPIGFEALPIVTATSTVAGATVTITQFVNVRSGNVAERTATVKVTATNGTDIVNYSVVATVTLAAGKSITAYSFSTPAATGTINNNANPRKIAVTVPGATSLTALVANFTASERATVKVGTTVQVSGVTANDFTTPVDYVVTAEDGTTIKYRVTVSFPVGISESKVNVLQIYPNPSTGFIALKNISSDEISQITITSMRGQIVKLLNTYDGGLINIHELGAGVYNLSVIKKDNTLSNLRFIKQ